MKKALIHAQKQYMKIGVISNALKILNLFAKAPVAK